MKRLVRFGVTAVISALALAGCGTASTPQAVPGETATIQAPAEPAPAEPDPIESEPTESEPSEPVVAQLTQGPPQSESCPVGPMAEGVIAPEPGEGWVPVPDSFPNANALVQAITVGWNLGNTLDSQLSSVRGATPTPAGQEMYWGNPVATQELILAVRDAGFNAVRIPVTWNAMLDRQYQIREDWLDRVQEVVDYAYQNGMIVILNTHHDNVLFSLHDDAVDQATNALATVWTQIAERFADYGDRLIFEGLNEPRTVGSATEWTGGTASERAIVNQLNQVFVDTVRAGTGHNPERFLMVPPYGASPAPVAMEDLVFPNDPAGPCKIIISVHAYSPTGFALGGENATAEWSVDGQGDSGPDGIDEVLQRAVTLYLDRGYPVIIGEMGAIDQSNTEARVAWVTYYIEQARERGIPTFWWDNGRIGANVGGATAEMLGLFNRNTYEITAPDIIAAIMSAAKS